MRYIYKKQTNKHNKQKQKPKKAKVFTKKPSCSCLINVDTAPTIFFIILSYSIVYQSYRFVRVLSCVNSIPSCINLSGLSFYLSVFPGFFFFLTVSCPYISK